MKKWNLKNKYVKVLIQEFCGKELIEPNKHYSKCIMLYDTTPKEVYEELLPFFAGSEVIKKKRRRKYHLSKEGKAKRAKATKAYWKQHQKTRTGKVRA